MVLHETNEYIEDTSNLKLNINKQELSLQENHNQTNNIIEQHIALSMDQIIEGKIDLLNKDERHQQPHAILYHSFNFKPKWIDKYISGNWIHKNMVTYCLYFLILYYEISQQRVYPSQQLSLEEIENLKKNFLPIKCRIGTQNKQLQRKSNIIWKQLASLAQIMKRSAQLDFKSQYSRQIIKRKNKLAVLFENFFSLFKNVKHSALIVQIKNQIQEFFQEYKASSAYSQMLDKRVWEQQTFRKQLQQFFNSQQYSIQQQMKLIEKSRSKIHEWQFENGQIKKIDCKGKQSSRWLCFGMGRISYIGQDNKHYIMKPLKYPLQQRLKNCNSANYYNSEQFHVERQVLEEGSRTIIQNLKDENMNFKESKAIIIDVFILFQACCKKTYQSQKYTCRQKIPLIIEEIRKFLEEKQELYVRVSYLTSTNKQQPRQSFVINQTGKIGQYIEHLIEIPQLFCGSQKKENISEFMKLFEPQNVFVSGGVNFNVYRKACERMRQL